MDYKEKYEHALERASKLRGQNPFDTVEQMVENIFPELKKSDENVREDIISLVNEFWDRIGSINPEYSSRSRMIAWLEKQGEIDFEHYKDGENEKRKFVGYGFLKCKGDFLSFKEGETYWLEYVGKDNYNVRSDNLLGQTFHIKPVELYTVFRPTTWLEKQKENSTEPEWCHHKVDLSNCSEEYRKAYYDGWNNCNMQHSQCETESNDEDEKIRKALKQGFFEYGKSFTKFGGIKVGDIIAWLEKLGKQSAYKIEPKFKVGDWIVQENIGVYKVIEICESWYEVVDNKDKHYSIGFDKEYMCHLWTLQDAKEGDVLAFDDNTIVIFKDLYNAITFHSYCHIEDGLFGVSEDGDNHGWEGEGFYPATKEQCNLLFQKMKEAGYELDSEKKELKKIVTCFFKK